MAMVHYLEADDLVVDLLSYSPGQKLLISKQIAQQRLQNTAVGVLVSGAVQLQCLEPAAKAKKQPQFHVKQSEGRTWIV
jgi:hypothetical protein